MMNPMKGCQGAEPAGTELPVGGESGPKIAGEVEVGLYVLNP